MKCIDIRAMDVSSIKTEADRVVSSPQSSYFNFSSVYLSS